jgi:spermidine synthase
VIHDPRVEVIHDDARHFVLTTHDTFDIITSDPIHPWVKGSATLYTAEYFQMCKEHLNPGGIVTQWVPLYESSEAVVKSQVATFFEAFPGGIVWANNAGREGYDTVLFGQVGPTHIDVDAIEERLEREDHDRVVESLDDVGFRSVGIITSRVHRAVSLFSTYAACEADLGQWLDGAEINRDRNLRLQYLAGMQLNRVQGSNIYNGMVKKRRFPGEIFTGTGLSSLDLQWQIRPGY